MAKNNFMFFRRLHGRLHEWRLSKQSEYRLWKDLMSGNGKKVYIVGTPEHSNVGDSAIVLAEIEFLKTCHVPSDNIKEITLQEYRRYHRMVRKCIRKSDIICWHGGGNMGNQWIEEEYFRRNVMKELKDNSMIIFPQTIFYTDTEEGKLEQKKSVEYYNVVEKLTLVAREQKSFEIMSKLYPDTKVLLMPDIVLSTTEELYDVKKVTKEDILLCLRNDSEKSLTNKETMEIECVLRERFEVFKRTDMHSARAITKENRKECVREKMQEFANARLVVTDRLHGMIFAAITSTPCIVFSNNNQKVSGTYKWIEKLQYVFFVESINEMEKILDAMMYEKLYSYDNECWNKKYESLREQIMRLYK